MNYVFFFNEKKKLCFSLKVTKIQTQKKNKQNNLIERMREKKMLFSIICHMLISYICML